MAKTWDVDGIHPSSKEVGILPSTFVIIKLRNLFGFFKKGESIGRMEHLITRYLLLIIHS